MNSKKTVLLCAALLLLLAFTYAIKLVSLPTKPSTGHEHMSCTPEHPACVMKTIFGLDNPPLHLTALNERKVSPDVKTAIHSGLQWIDKAQLPDGGWGAGLHMRQDIRDPHAVAADPATTSLVLLSLLRTGNSLDSGQYRKQVASGTEFLLKAVEQWPENQPRLTTLSGTQPQRKLGENIDAILTVQYFTTLLKYQPKPAWKERIENALQKCVGRIEKEQDTDGGWKGGGWAPVLQSALADKALESAKDAGMAVNDAVIRKSKQYQQSNFDTATQSAITGKAAGVMLYSLSSTARSSAKEARRAKMLVEKGKKEGKIKAEESLNEEVLVKAGSTPSEAKELVTAYKINESTKTQSLRADVMEGFGSNGGEELMSYLMTGESILMQGGNDWKQWYESMSQKIMAIQNNDGSWEGHHCITSPVFCTATALLILSIQEDMDKTDPRGF